MRASPIRCSATGPVDLVLINGPASHLELIWEEPLTARCFERLGSFARVVMFDRRGTGLSDAVSPADARAADGRSVRRARRGRGRAHRAVGRQRPRALGAVRRHLPRARQLAGAVLGRARRAPRRSRPSCKEVFLDAIENSWGDGTLVSVFAPSQVGNRAFEEWWGRMQRSAVSPGMARQLIEMLSETDLQRGPADDPRPDARHPPDRRPATSPSRSAARSRALIPGARFIEYPGHRHLRLDGGAGDRRRRGVPDRPASAPPRSTACSRPCCSPTSSARPSTPSRLGDGRWRELLDEHHTVVRHELERWRGTEVKTIGDGFLATFDGPARAVRCAAEIVRRRSSRSASSSAPACTPASASSSATTSPGSRSTSARA